MVKATSLDMSLADIIKTKKTKKVVRKAGGIKKRAAGPAGSANGTPRRQSGGIRKTIRKPAPISPAARNEKKRTVRINVSNLAPSVASSDLRDLFGEFRLRNASVNFNESGNHLGTGDILLSKLDADRLIQKYAGVALDGKVYNLVEIVAFC
uniref:RRM domain-containing protein n=1 Tax=Caenorhabditis japonica TaxID=281687 RepID=A0A8R1EUK2_CAEJA